MEMEMLVFCETRKTQQDKYCMTTVIWAIVRVGLIGSESEMVGRS